MNCFAEVRFKGRRCDYYRYEGMELAPGDPVVVEADHGEDLGRVTAVGNIAQRKCEVATGCPDTTPTRQVLRRAADDDVRRAGFQVDDERWAHREVRRRVAKRKLAIKITDTEWRFDRKVLFVYYTAQRKVDFRGLIRELATAFRTRIELKKVGIREEAAMLGGVGRCGRELCSATWLPELKPVSLQVAKDQNLSLNPSQISGCCGRLMCCLKFEHDRYLEARRRFPREGRRLRTAKGREQVVGVNIFADTITLRDDSGDRRIVRVEDLKREVRGASRTNRRSR